MNSDFFYSKSTKLYVARKPLKINSRTKEAIEKNGIEANWDDEGRINYINYKDARRLLKALNSQMMTPIEYWLILKDATEENDIDMISSLQSSDFCEWLNRVYLKDGGYIDNPHIELDRIATDHPNMAEYPHGRPGWFSPKNNINYKNGLPITVNLFRDKFENSWKYWSPDFSVTPLKYLAPIRGYVTSVGKPSLDLGIPINSKQPVQMVRECRQIPLQLPVEWKILKRADQLIDIYKSLTNDLKNKEKYRELRKHKKEYLKFLERFSCKFTKSKELVVSERREQFFNILGLLRLLSSDNSDFLNEFSICTKGLSGINPRILRYTNLVLFVRSSEKRLRSALKNNRDIVFVMGHENPDADTVTSSIFEALRNQLIDTGTEYIPIVQSTKIPDEIEALLGAEISHSLILYDNKLYLKAKLTGLSRWISVDQNRDKNAQKFFISIVDHHFISEVASKQDIPKTLEMCGSCTGLIAIKFLGMGITFDKKAAKILYGATLLDTENRVFHKMTIKDRYIMDYLQYISQIKNDNEYYSYLMSFLLNTDDPDILFKRDYKEDWGFGFAVAKVKNSFDKSGGIKKNAVIDKAITLARKNNKDKNLPLTIFRITDYLNDCTTVNRERVYLVFNDLASNQFKYSVFKLLKNIIKFEFPGSYIKEETDFLEFWGTGMQLSRKKTAPQMEPLVKSYNEYFYSPSTSKWIKRGFLEKTNDTMVALKKENIPISTDKSNRINYITYSETKRLLKNLEFTMLSLKDYWLVLQDAKRVSDVQMIESLQGSNFVEFLDTVIIKNKEKIDHPCVSFKNTQISIKGKREQVAVKRGKPGLISVSDIDLETGFPKFVRNPDEYGNPNLWRYWEPDDDIVNPVRSYIFLLKQPCLDCKMHPKDSFPNLGIRPVTDRVIPPQIDIKIVNNFLKMVITSEGSTTEYKWKNT